MGEAMTEVDGERNWQESMRSMGAVLRGERKGMPIKPSDRMDLVSELASFLNPEERARWLVRNGYKQVSRKGCMVARLPDGLSGREALRLAREAYEGGNLTDDEYAQIARRSHADAEDEFCRVYAMYLGTPFVIALDTTTFTHYRRLGGGTAR